MNMIKWFILALGASTVALVLSHAAESTQDHGSSTKGAPASIHPLKEPGLTNFYQLTSNVFSGAAPDGEAGFASLKALGIKTIITVDGAKPDVNTAKKFGLRYVHLPIGYDGVPTAQALRLVKAVETLPGPVYIHCHHGLHRGPAGAAAVCIGTAGWTGDQAVAWLQLAGTSSNYPGLFKTVAAFTAPSSADLQKVSTDFPEVSPISALAEEMVKLDNSIEHLKLIKAAGYKAPPSSPDLDPENESLLLHEQMKEMYRSPLVQSRPADFQDKFTTTEEAANSLHLSFLIQPFDSKRADAAFQRMNDGCDACHKAYRN